MKILRSWRLLIAAIFVSVLIVSAFYYGITTKTYTIKTDKLSKGTSLRIVLISDLHNTIHGNNQKSLIEKITKQNPDLILLTGDIGDDVAPLKGTQLLLSGINDIAPIFYVTGNHEYWSYDIQAFRDMLQSFGVTTLSDQFVQLKWNGIDIIIAGVEDPDKKKYESPDYNQAKAMAEAFGDLHKSDAYKILLAHRPENIESYQKYPFDLVVSGHAHGGQVRIPFFINGLYAPNQGWFPAYVGGLYQHDTLYHIISRGLSINPRLPRIFNPPELVVISVEPDL